MVPGARADVVRIRDFSCNLKENPLFLSMGARYLLVMPAAQCTSLHLRVYLQSCSFAATCLEEWRIPASFCYRMAVLVDSYIVSV